VIVATCGWRMRPHRRRARERRKERRRNQRGPKKMAWSACGHHCRRCAGRTVEEEEDDDTVKRCRTAHHELTATSHAGVAQCAGKRSGNRVPGVLHISLLTTFYRFASSSGCLEIAIRTPHSRTGAGLKESAWQRPSTSGTMGESPPAKDEGDLWDALTAFDGKDRAALFAHCASSRSTRSMSLPTANNEGVSRRIVSSTLGPSRCPGSCRQTRHGGSGWKPTVKLSRSRHQARISKRYARPRASNRCSSSTTSRKATWPERPSGCSMLRAGCRAAQLTEVAL